MQIHVATEIQKLNNASFLIFRISVNNLYTIPDLIHWKHTDGVYLDTGQKGSFCICVAVVQALLQNSQRGVGRMQGMLNEYVSARYNSTDYNIIIDTFN